MPQSTISYPFEHRVFDWLNGLSVWARPGDPQSFLLTLSPAGDLRTLTFERSAASWHEEVEALRRQGLPFILFDPFDYPEYAGFGWFGVQRTTMERLIGKAFADTDFQGGRDGDMRYPETWSVVY